MDLEESAQPFVGYYAALLEKSALSNPIYGLRAWNGKSESATEREAQAMTVKGSVYEALEPWHVDGSAISHQNVLVFAMLIPADPAQPIGENHVERSCVQSGLTP